MSKVGRRSGLGFGEEVPLGSSWDARVVLRCLAIVE